MEFAYIILSFFDNSSMKKTTKGCGNGAPAIGQCNMGRVFCFIQLSETENPPFVYPFVYLFFCSNLE